MKHNPWQGRPYTEHTGSIGDLRQKIPTFTISDFRIGRQGVNEFLSVIAREPLGEIDIGDEVDPKNSMRIPVASVEKEDIASSKGYKLVQHHEALDSILNTLEQVSSFQGGDFRKISKSLIKPLKDPESLKAKLQISKYGARMQIEFCVPQYELYWDNGDPYILKVSCSNSVDKSKALVIDLSWCRGSDTIIIDRFHRNHRHEQLKKGAIERFLKSEFERLSRKPSPRPAKGKVERALRKKFAPNEVQEILKIYERLVEIHKTLTKNTVERRGVDLPMLSQAILSLHHAIEKDPKSIAELRNQQIRKFSEVKKDVLKKKRKKIKVEFCKKRSWCILKQRVLIVVLVDKILDAKRASLEKKVVGLENKLDREISQLCGL